MNREFDIKKVKEPELSPARPNLFKVAAEIEKIGNPGLRYVIYTCSDPELLSRLALGFPECFSAEPSLEPVEFSLEKLQSLNRQCQIEDEELLEPLNFAPFWKRLDLPGLVEWYAGYPDEDSSITNAEAEEIKKYLIGKVAEPFMKIDFRGVSCVIVGLGSEGEVVSPGDIITEATPIDMLHIGPDGLLKIK